MRYTYKEKEKSPSLPLVKGYAHIEIVVDYVFDFLDIPRYHQVGFRINLQEIHRTGLPDLSETSGTSKNIRQTNVYIYIYIYKDFNLKTINQKKLVTISI